MIPGDGLPGSPGETRSGALRDWTPEIVFLAITTAAGVWAAGRWVDPMGDAGSWWTLLHRLASGEKLYRDVFLQYGPFSPYFLSFVGAAVGLSPTSFLLINWVPGILLGLILLRAGRPYLSELERISVAGFLVVLELLGTSRLVFPYSPAAVHALIFSVLALRLLQRDPPRHWDGYLAGGLAGLASCCKQEIGLIALLALWVPVVARSSRDWKWLRRTLAGFSCVALLGLLVVFASASLESLRYDNHYWPIGGLPAAWKHLSGLTTGFRILGWQLRLAGALFSFLYYAALIALLGMLLARDSRVRRPVLLLLLGALLIGGAVDGELFGRRADPFSLSMLVAFALVFAAFFDRHQPGRDFLIGFGLFAGLIGARTAFAGRLGWSPYSGVAQVSMALTWVLFLSCFLPRLFPGGKGAAAMTRRIWALVLLPVAALGAWSGVRDIHNQVVVPVRTPLGRVWVSRAAGPFFSTLARNLRPGERVLVLPEPHGVEALFKLRSASPLLFHMPGWLDSRTEEALLRRFAVSPPAVVVFFARDTAEFGVRPFGQGFGTRLAPWLERNYVVGASAPGGLVLRRKP